MGSSDDQQEQAGERPVGRSGARFPSRKLREMYSKDEKAEPAPESRAEPRPPPEPPPEPPPSEPPPRAERVLASPDPPADDPFDPMEQYRLRVRPYVLTKGRTQARQDLAVETLISTDPQAPWDREQLSSEYQAVRRMCMQPRSVAEVAALLSVPLGVARVLLSDLADAGLVHVHSNAATETGRPDFDLLQRVLDALHRL